ncbi:MAG TPA: DsbA family oxidoreductase [Acetobacteraceae bacterium]|nr:DsbA family oxidoreductase [Acetobacteraceae bacterium]
MLAPRAMGLPVEIVFDFVCPWCYLGIHRLNRLRMRRRDLVLDTLWRPFLLNPDMPRLGISRADYSARKFGGEERARRLYASITEVAAAEGLIFDFARIRRTPSSVDAHRLVRLAARMDRADEIVAAIFQAYFQNGADIGQIETLVHIAAMNGLDPLAARRFLLSDEAVELVHADNLHAHRLGINGVPCFLINGTHAIAGAQEPEVLERLIDLSVADLRSV